MNENNRFEEISIQDIVAILAKRWWVVAITLGIGVILIGIVTIFFIDPVYQADTSLYVGKDIESQGAIAYNDLVLGDRLVSDYRELAKSRQITGIVIKDLDLEMTSAQLAAKINVTSKRDTRIIEITVQDTNPRTAMKIANSIAETFQLKAIEIMRVDNVQIIDEAIEPLYPIKPNKKLNLAIAVMLSMMIGVAIVFLIEYFDKTIKTPEDIKDQIGLPVIGVIPDFDKL